MKTFVWVCLAGLLLCRASLAARAPTRVTEAESPRRLAYEFDFSHPGRVHVSLETSSPASGTELLCLPTRWAEARELERAIQNLKITGSEVSLQPTGRPARFILRAKPGTGMRLEYDLIQDWDGPYRPSERHRVLLRPELVEFNGENGLVAPKMEGSVAVEVSFQFQNLPAGETVVTSFGRDDRQTMRGRWSEVENALFVAGVLSTRQITVAGGPVLLATAGKFSFSEEELALKAHQILRAERAFWGGTPPPWYAIVLTPFQTGTLGGGGSAFTNALSLSLSPAEHFGTEAESLLAHEAFHAWNPAAFGLTSDPATLGWFVEGFTTYYQDVLLERSGLLDRAGYVKRVNALLRDDLTAPLATTMGDGTAVRSLDDDEARMREPYLRGAEMALWLNAEIERQSADRLSLDDLMRAMLLDAAQPLTPERIFGVTAHFVNAATVRQMENFAAGSEPVPLSSVPGKCAQFTPTEVWTFSLGMPTGELVSGGKVRAVDESSAAYQAGLRNGQTLIAWSFWNGDPDHDATLTVRDGDAAGDARRIRYLPRGRQITIPQAKMVAGCTGAATGVANEVPGEPKNSGGR